MELHLEVGKVCNEASLHLAAVYLTGTGGGLNGGGRSILQMGRADGLVGGIAGQRRAQI